MAQGKQAKILTRSQEKVVLAILTPSRYPVRNKVLFLLSIKAGLRAKEISALTWPMVCDASNDIAGAIELPNVASKGKGGGRSIPINAELRAALVELSGQAHSMVGAVIRSERGGHMHPVAICSWFERLYKRAGLAGCSSHSGRRTFITRAARKVSTVGGSLRDIQQLAGHSNLATTQRYIEGSASAKLKIVDLV